VALPLTAVKSLIDARSVVVARRGDGCWQSITGITGSGRSTRLGHRLGREAAAEHSTCRRLRQTRAWRTPTLARLH
jgi:hypothetical protein